MYTGLGLQHMSLAGRGWADTIQPITLISHCLMIIRSSLPSNPTRSANHPHIPIHEDLLLILTSDTNDYINQDSTVANRNNWLF